MLSVRDLHMTYTVRNKKAPRAVEGVSFEVGRGEFFTLLGPSGCGKTTTLRCVAGLEQPDTGTIEVGGRAVFSSADRVLVPPHKRGIGMVFQSYAIWPHMLVEENVAFPLRVQRKHRNRARMREDVSRALATVGLGGYEKRSATKLSGGQQQRLALARALVWEPELLLLDEPLSNLDASLREEMRLELKRVQTELAITSVYVTHDQVEALAISDRIAVMQGGKILQIGSPRDIYSNPTSLFVAKFVGNTNLVAGTVTSVDGDGAAAVSTAHGVLRGRSGGPLRAGQRVEVAIRPEDLVLTTSEAPDAGAGTVAVDGDRNVFSGTCANQIFLGEIAEYRVRLANGDLLNVRESNRGTQAVDRSVRVAVPSASCRVFAADSEVDAAPAAAEETANHQSPVASLT